MTHVLAEFSTPLVMLAKQENRVSEGVHDLVLRCSSHKELVLCLSASACLVPPVGLLVQMHEDAAFKRSDTKHKNCKATCTSLCVCVKHPGLITKSLFMLLYPASDSQQLLSTAPPLSNQIFNPPSSERTLCRSTSNSQLNALECCSNRPPHTLPPDSAVFHIAGAQRH